MNKTHNHPEHSHEAMPESNPEGPMHDHTVHGEDHAAHVDHRGHEMMFHRRFWISTLISIPVLLFSPFVQDTLVMADHPSG